MLKFFRKYNKIILAVGGSLLMVVFLLQPAMDLFMPTGANRTAVETNGEPITYGQQSQANGELALLQRLHPLLGLDVGEDAVTWVRILRNAQALKLSASDAEVAQLLAGLSIDDAQLGRTMAAMRVTREVVQETTRKYLAAAKYRQLVTGNTHITPIDRLVGLASGQQLLFQAQQLARQGNQFASLVMLQANVQLALTQGSQRLSLPLVQHTIRDNQARIAGRAMVISQDALDEIPEPTDEQIEQLFLDYRDDLQGEGEPYGFGYRIPDRVKIEYIVIPVAEMTQSMMIDEVEAIEFYRENQEDFPVLPSDAPDSMANETFGAFPNRAVRDRVIEAFRAEKGQEQAERIARAARNLMLEPLRSAEEVSGYKVIEESVTLPSVREVADRLTQQYSVAIDYRADQDQWITVKNAGFTPAIGESQIADSEQVIYFQDYIASAKELNPDPSNPLVLKRLQVGVPAEAMSVKDGNWYVFRLTDAQVGHIPDTITEVFPRVEADARKLAIYEKLKTTKGQWILDAMAEELETIAIRANSEVMTLGLTSRVDINRMGDPILTSPTVLDAMFEMAGNIGTKFDLDDVSRPEKVAVIELPEALSLVIVELDDYRPVTQEQYDRSLAQPTTPAEVSLTSQPRDNAVGIYIHQIPLPALPEAEEDQAADQTDEEAASPEQDA